MKYKIDALSVFKTEIIVEAESSLDALNEATLIIRDNCYSDGSSIPTPVMDKLIPADVWPVYKIQDN
jgi:hypothetical protein